MKPSCDITLTIPFHDLDPLNVVWHGNYYKYFDIARFALFRTCGVDLDRYAKDAGFLFPVSRSSAKYIAPLRHNDVIVCRAVVTEAKYKIAMDFTIRRADDNTLCARGTSDQVTVRLPDMTLEFEVPEDIQHALGNA